MSTSAAYAHARTRGPTTKQGVVAKSYFENANKMRASMEAGATPQPQVPTQYSPFALFGLGAHYGLGNWLECPPGTPAAGFDQPTCDAEWGVRSSPGKFGFYPWTNLHHDFFGVMGVFNERGGPFFASKQSGTASKPPWCVR